MKINEPYNPLDKKNLGMSVADALLSKVAEPLPPAAKFKGAGVYALYYTGNFPEYKHISEGNIHKAFTRPIYVGKAVPQGARKGGFGLDTPTGRVLFKRLDEHAKAIMEAENLEIKDFFCRHLIVDDIWIPLGESLLIETFKPLWNMVVDGFGNHDPGKGRYNQQVSPWDILHPGRSWASKLKPGKSKEQVISEVRHFLKRPS